MFNTRLFNGALYVYTIASVGFSFALAIDNIFMLDCISVPLVFTSAIPTYLLSSEILASTAIVLDI